MHRSRTYQVILLSVERFTVLARNGKQDVNNNESVGWLSIIGGWVPIERALWQSMKTTKRGPHRKDMLKIMSKQNARVNILWFSLSFTEKKNNYHIFSNFPIEQNGAGESQQENLPFDGVWWEALLLIQLPKSNFRPDSYQLLNNQKIEELLGELVSNSQPKCGRGRYAGQAGMV